MPADTLNRNHHPALDGLRGAAILLVVVYHNFGFINYFSFGWLGVDLFFVLSGFLITDILLNTVGKPGYLKNFYLRRALRIFPLYFLCLLIFLFLLPALFPPPGVGYYQDNQFWLWTYLQNWLYIFKPTDATPLHHLWSLAVEEQFYLVWPLIILVVRKTRILLLIICLILAAVIGLRLWAWMNHDANFAYYQLYTFSRIDGICIGCMVALLQRINKNFFDHFTAPVVLFFAVLNFTFFLINRQYRFSFPYLALAGYTTFAMLFGLLVNEAITRKTKIINLLFDNQLLRFFGKISYGFYVFHWPLYIILAPRLESWLTGKMGWHTMQFSISLSATLFALAISWLSYQYFEKYFLQLKKRFA
jgi:peptidoglycan/LPS O-acetylase OafA/YrhL